MKIIGVATSPRKGKTTAESLKICLEAAKAVAPGIETELIELAGLSIDGAIAAGIAPAPGAKDDFPAVAEKLSDPRVAGIIVGSPVYFGMMSALCKAFIDRCMAFRKGGFALHDKVLGVVAVGAARNGGQELTIQAIQSCLMCQEMIVVGDGRPTAHRGATLWSQGDSIAADEVGIGTAKNLGRRVAEVALRLAAGA
ncbi:MAG: flavodoxin family protein [Planctomycetes bacterium]|nr:flavodoxin family protein [Planctomycetota bacterium]